jgi:hypothetical protein
VGARIHSNVMQNMTVSNDLLSFSNIDNIRFRKMYLTFLPHKRHSKDMTSYV